MAQHADISITEMCADKVVVLLESVASDH